MLEGARGRRRAPGGRRKAPEAEGRRRAQESAGGLTGEHRAQKDALECAGGRRRAPGGRQRPPEAAGGRRRPPEGAGGRGRPPEAARGSKSTPQPKRASCGKLTSRKGDISVRQMQATKTGKREGPERQAGVDAKVDAICTLRRGGMQLCIAIYTVLEAWTQKLTLFARKGEADSIESL